MYAVKDAKGLNTDGSINYAEEYTYEHNRLKTVKDRMGKVVETYTYNTYGEVASVTDALGNVTTYEYDNTGRLANVVMKAKDATGDMPLLAHSHSFSHMQCVISGMSPLTQKTVDGKVTFLTIL